MRKMTTERFLLSLAAVLTLMTGCSSLDEFYFNTQPQDLIVERHQTVLWDCNAQGEEPISYTWYYEGASINSSFKRILDNGTLKIIDVSSRRDVGNYSCCASNPLGVLCGVNVSLSIATLPQFTVNPESVNVTEGSTARLSCQIEGKPPPVIIWKKNRRILEMSGSSNPRYTVLPGGVLQIDNVVPSDAGEFKCQASNLLRVRNSRAATLQVLPPFEGPLPQVPEIVVPPRTTIRQVGEFAVLECIANHPSYTISWSRQGDGPIRTDGVNYIGRSNLFFISVRLSDAGIYICTATNTETALSVFSQARLVVHEAPAISRRDLKDRSGISVGSIARFSCKVSGVPSPMVKWYFEGKEVLEKDRRSIQENNDLVINQVRVSDRGIYQCVAINAAGKDIASALLEPIELTNEPHAPRNLRVNFTTSTKVKLVWDPPLPGISFVAFSIHYQETGGTESPLPLPNSLHSYVLEDLKPFTTYEIYAVSWSRIGPSPPSNKVYVTTKEDVPRMAPDFVASSSTHDAINIKWNDIEDSAKNGILINYVITYAEVEEDNFSTVTVPGDQTEYTLSGLDANTEYRIRMAAATSIGPGEFSSWVTVQTLNLGSDELLPPPVVDFHPLNHTSIEISINVVDGSSDVLGFLVKVINKDGEIVKDLVIPISTLVFAVSGLEPRTTYEVHVRAYNEEGDGHTASGTVVTQPQPVCSNGFPPQFNLTARSPHSLLVTWQQSLTDLPALGYTIRYSTAVTNATRAEIPYKPGREESPPYQLEIGNLEPFTYYQVEIRVHIPNCSGLFGSSQYVQTLQDLPSSVTEVDADPLDPYSIRLSWHVPERPNGVITHYVIMYNDNPEADIWTKLQQNGTNEKSIVRNLKSNTEYYFKVQAGTQVGEGPPNDPPVMAKTLEVPEGAHEKEIGILIGVVLALICIIICCTFLLIRYRNPNRGKGSLSIVSAQGQLHPNREFMCNGRCHIRDRACLPQGMYYDDPEVFLPMLPHGHALVPSQGIYQNGRPAYPLKETLNMDSDLSNHSASSGFVDSSSQAGDFPKDGTRVSLQNKGIHRDNCFPTYGQGKEIGAVYQEAVKDGNYWSDGMRPHVRYMDPELVGRSRETEVPLLEKMLKSTVPTEETQV